MVVSCWHWVNLAMTEHTYVGLMCGTSMDAVDAVLVRFSSRGPNFELIETLSLPVPKRLKQQALHFSTYPTAQIPVADLDEAYGLLFANAVLQLLQKAKIPPSSVKAIGSHGQTLKHCPDASPPYTLQVGNPHRIASITGIQTIANFREADILQGGQGAPLAPAFHRWAFQSFEENRWVVNIGGIANITWLPCDTGQPVIGFDTGPGNSLLDAWSQRFLGQPFDASGAWAKTGKVNEALLGVLRTAPYFETPPPKSTGKELFNLSWVDRHLQQLNQDIPAQDVIRTLVSLTAETILLAIESFNAPGSVFVCGGGVHNTFLMETVARGLPLGVSMDTTLALGLSPDWVEATCFAWLAQQRLANQPANLPSVTGAKEGTLLGDVVTPATVS